MKTITDHNSLIDFYKSCNLEFPDTGYVGKPLFSIIYGEPDEIVGALTVTTQNEDIIIDDIAVEEQYRKKGIGKALIKRAIEMIKRMKLTHAVYAITKEPSFFHHMGFHRIERSEAPDFSICFNCEQFQVNCFPVPMKMIID